MNLFNKLVVGASAVAFAAALTAGVGATSADASSLADSTSVYLDNQSYIHISENGDTKVSVSYPTMSKKGLSADKNICTYDMTEDGVDVDLSTLNVTKTNYIKIVGNKNDDPIVLKIDPATTLGKATVSASNGAITVGTKAAPTTPIAADKLQYATTTSNWENMEDMDSEMYLQLGATIRVRKEADDVILSDATVTDGTDVKSVGYKLYSLKGTFASKEIKAKIKKMANGPKVSIDLAKHTIKVPKKAQYRVNTAEGNGTWTYVADGISLDETKFDITKKGAVDVRTAATDKKPASKFTVAAYKAMYTFGVETDTNDTTGATASLVSTASGVSAAVTGGAVTAKYTISPAVKKTATSAAVTIDNKSKIYTYQYMTATTAPTATTTKGIKTVKTEKTATISKSSFKKDTVLYIRRAAVTKGVTEWSTPWVKVMTYSASNFTMTIG